MVAANEAALIARVSAREVYRLVEGGQLHFIEDRNGLMFVCFLSLCDLAGEATTACSNPNNSNGQLP